MFTVQLFAAHAKMPHTHLVHIVHVVHVCLVHTVQVQNAYGRVRREEVRVERGVVHMIGLATLYPNVDYCSSR